MMESHTELLLFLEQYSEIEPEVLLDKSIKPALEPGIDPIRLKQLKKLEQQALHCTQCGLHKTRINVVFGTGNPNARLMFVGEGPGADEDRQGKPFVGRAGQLLNRILAAMKLSREDVYIGNIIKCRPPGNRNPQPIEAHECLPYLKQQIVLIDPDVIVALGLVAAVHLLGLAPNVSVKSLRSRIHDCDGKPLVVTYHPAALLRSPTYKAPTWDDMQVVMKLLSGEITFQPSSFTLS